jgi:hypothetical protein
MRTKLFLGLGILLVGLVTTPFLTRAVTVGPPRLEYSLDPGQTITGSMIVINEGGDTQTFYPSFERFTEDNGEKVFTKETSDLATWFRMEQAVTLKGGQSQSVPFSIVAPPDAAPGGHFAVIWWSTTPPGQSKDQVAIVTRAGVLVYVRVSGNIVEDGSIQDFEVDHSIATSLPLTFTTVFKNSGNVGIKPTGLITIKNLFGVTVITVPFNKELGFILPQSRKSFNSVWLDTGFHFGIYHAVLDLKYGDSEKTASAARWILILSPLGIAGLILLIFLIIGLPPTIRKYNRWIIERSRG